MEGVWSHLCNAVQMILFRCLGVRRRCGLDTCSLYLVWPMVVKSDGQFFPRTTEYEKMVYDARVTDPTYLRAAPHASEHDPRTSSLPDGFGFRSRAGDAVPHMIALPAFPSSNASPLPPTASPTPLRYFSLSPIFFPALSQRCWISFFLSAANAFSAGQ